MEKETMKYKYYGTDYRVNWRAKMAIEKEQAKLVAEIRSIIPVIGPRWKDMTDDERAEVLDSAKRSAERKLDDRRQQRKSKRRSPPSGPGLFGLIPTSAER
jgi:hypothetical protein